MERHFLPFRHPPASRLLAAQTGGPSGAEGDLFTERRSTIVCATGSRSRAPLGPPVSLRSPEDDESESVHQCPQRVV
jgi:hypothetical protein